jgi:phage shock protein C
VVLLMVLPGSQFLVYPLLWFLMPSDDSVIAASHAPRPLR